MNQLDPGGRQDMAEVTWRELDYRETPDGVAIALEWNPETDALRVTARDRTTLHVVDRFPSDRALDVFEHPYGWQTRAEMIAAAP